MQTTSKHAPTARDDRFHTALRYLGELMYGEPVELHHVFGASARQNKIRIGQRAVVALPSRNHNSFSQDDLNVTTNKKGFEARTGSQKLLCFRQHLTLVGAMALGYVVLDVSDLSTPEELAAIEEYSK